ncbi:MULTISPECIES: FUSC family protein [unclassified Rhodococcus (in: high G+C Gram-positive bacteria)]|uniref:FUSC family protein n=1 Tax=unclassified Rhodococcus (in: high G+C Gram-positive bacteria) TaxID=192944 RepID=UPI001FFC2A6F|nr:MULTISPECIES: FUSC family protein [unclassified Rhodococcus (in: high G+C Gram-positive bacteria)]
MPVPVIRLDHTRSALAHATSRAAWRQAMTLGHADATIAPALRVGAAIAVVLVGGGILGRPELAGFAALGALCSAFTRYEPYPRRAGKLALVGGSIVLWATLGAVVGTITSSSAIHIFAISLAAGVAALALSAFSITGPGPVILVFASTAAVGFASAAGDVVEVFVSVSIGAAIGWVAAMLPALLHPVGPGQLAVARALAATDSRQDGIARASIEHARVIVALNTRPTSRDHSLGLTTLLDDAEQVLDAWARGENPSHAAEILAHERALRKMRRYDALPVRAAELATTPENFFAVGVRMLTSRALVINAARIAVASLLAAWCATAFGFEHPLWATMGAMAALQGITFHTTVERGIQRLLGNVGGAVIAAALIAGAFGYWQTTLAIIVLQIVAELLVMKNYGLTTIAVTPMALLLTGIAGQLSPAVAISRVGDTLIGVLIGIVVAALTIGIGDKPARELTGVERHCVR